MIDELVSGVASVAAPDIERSLAASHALTAAVLFLVPGIAAFAVEPWLFALADRHPRAIFVHGGLVAMAVASLAAALAPGAIALAAALSILWIAIGASSSLAQATLVDTWPERRARTIARYTLLSLAGDLGAPALLAVLALAGGTWRGAFAIVAALTAVCAAALASARFPPPPPREPDGRAAPAIGVVAAMRAALADRVLLGWLFAMMLCDLLDEILIVFSSLYVREHGSALAQTATVAAFVTGGAIGLVAVDRVLRRRGELDTLLATALACAIAYSAWLVVPHPALMALVGATAAPLYPLVSARAYAARPGTSGIVLAAGHVFTPVALALPFALGAVADRAGTWTALALLLAQPLGIAALATTARRAAARGTGAPAPSPPAPAPRDTP